MNVKRRFASITNAFIAENCLFFVKVSQQQIDTLIAIDFLFFISFIFFELTEMEQFRNKPIQPVYKMFTENRKLVIQCV